MAVMNSENVARQPAPAKARKTRRVLRWASRLVALAAFACFCFLIGGFFVFADGVVHSRPPANPHADGIVALTGGTQRIEGAVSLLGNGSARRLLISGVHTRIGPQDLAARHPDLADFYRCCIDIGYEARNTRGNALETRDWARERGYNSLIVVTSDYHMPRSLTEIARVLPDVKLVPYPVRPDDLTLDDWAADPRAFKVLALEYMKYVWIRMGGSGTSFDA
ncbi:YdcF family protein [Faunimonas pinastri]|nr:YdcF family protein [Faunimonas pinastri]